MSLNSPNIYRTILLLILVGLLMQFYLYKIIVALFRKKIVSSWCCGFTPYSTNALYCYMIHHRHGVDCFVVVVLLIVVSGTAKEKKSFVFVVCFLVLLSILCNRMLQNRPFRH